ncbi:MAG: hypothetical protein R2762_14725 [Bryobacteraceae bacterium]
MAGLKQFDVTHALDCIRRQSRLSPNELRLLTHVVEQALAGEADSLTQKTLAADVFGRDLASFDPRADSIVRTTAANLRERLLEYYASAGRTDPVIIELPKGSYQPRFSQRQQLSAAGSSRLWSARLAMEGRTPTLYKTAVRHLDRVLSESPDLALALALKAEALASWAIHGAEPKPALTEARALADRALESDPAVWQASLARGAVASALEWDWPAAGRHFEKAVELSGGDAGTHPWYTAYLVTQGRPSEAVANLQRSVDHHGFGNPACLADLAMMQILARDYKAATETARAALEAAPDNYQHYMTHAVLLEAQDDPAAALRVLDQSPIRLQDRPVTWGFRAFLSGRSAGPSVARRRLSWFRAVQRTGVWIPNTQLCLCWMGIGDHDKAMYHLELAAEDREPLVIWYHAYPFFRHLRDHPRFEVLLARVGATRYLPGQEPPAGSHVPPIAPGNGSGEQRALL